MKSKIILSSLAGTLLALAVSALPVSALTLSRELDIGAQGDDVSALQTFLATDSSIYPEGLVTGYYGSLTAAAVARWQTAHGIDAVGRVGPVTLAALNNATGGVSLPASGADVSAPIVSAPIISTTSSSANIGWTTSEPAVNRVMYGTIWPFLYAAAPSAASTGGLSANANVTISGLNPNTTYYYVLESVDASGNLQWSIDHSFTTNQ